MKIQDTVLLEINVPVIVQRTVYLRILKKHEKRYDLDTLAKILWETGELSHLIDFDDNDEVVVETEISMYQVHEKNSVDNECNLIITPYACSRKIEDGISRNVDISLMTFD